MDVVVPESMYNEAGAEKLENAFLFALVWSFGAALKEHESPRYDKLLRAISGKTVPKQSFFESYYDINLSQWCTWESQVRNSCIVKRYI